MQVPARIKKAYETVKKVRERAYAPYSKFRVGAAVIAKSGKVYFGCNVENASYGGAICAERVAFVKAVSEGAIEFSDVIVVTGAQTPAFPCALCLQTMAEFLNPDAKIWLGNQRGLKSVYLFSDLLPHPFGPSDLKKTK